ncbi:Ricin B lectin domain-containing protein [Madurella fahalii]|uniref:Ricin B lectin domain-containing protein n=1 Tax=Madurella fahalii TaxID=1157608 RepID=A0ABQ0G4Q1_9PEZI
MLSLKALVLGMSWSAAIAAGQSTNPVQNLAGVSAHPFDMSAVHLTDSRWMANQNRTVNYLKSVDVERLLYNFRANHRLSTRGAAANGGWDAPDFPFRTHAQGHYLTSWAHCYASLGDLTCRDRATYFVAELAKCQANNAAAGFGAGYLSGFPESEFTALEARRLSNGNVPYYAIHKTLAGLLDVWRHVGDTKARDVLLGLAGWVDSRTSRLSYDQMQAMLGTEFGGMNDVLAEIYQQTGDRRWLGVAQRFDHAAVFDPLASNRDQLNGLHANTQVPKWIGAAREYQSTGTTRYRDIARNAWRMTVEAHTYAIGGNSQAEHFRPPNAIAQYLNRDTAEGCNTYNMLKLTRELWRMDPNSTGYFDFYEQALINHLLGQQNPADHHGHITYFTPLNPGGRRGVGPAWGGGTWSTDYNSFWCCQGTGLETNTKLMDSIYFHTESTLFVNLFTPSVLKWSQRNVTIQQTTAFPVEDTVTLTIEGGGDSEDNWELRVRIPSWTSGAGISVNGEELSGVRAAPGTYASVARAWRAGDRVEIRLPMKLRTVPANDRPNVAAVAYGPVILAGNYGSSSLASMPTLRLDSLRRASGTDLAFTATADGRTVDIGPFYNAQGFNYNVYWITSGQLRTDV